MNRLIDELLNDEGLDISADQRKRWISTSLFIEVLRAKRDTSDEADRAALTTIAKSLAADAGAPYQPDLIG